MPEIWKRNIIKTVKIYICEMKKRSITAKNQAVMNIWVKKEQEDKIMQRIGLDKNWDFYESDESMSFVFATPPSHKVDLPHDFIVGKPRSADAPGGP